MQWAVNLGKNLGHILVTTSDSRGLPYAAAARKIVPVKDEKVAVSEWFCPTTLENLQHNRLISLVIWDAVLDKGYQLLGEVEGMENEAMMNGYASEPGIKEPMAQVKWKLMVRVDKVIDFTQAPHNDMVE